MCVPPVGVLGAGCGAGVAGAEGGVPARPGRPAHMLHDGREAGQLPPQGARSPAGGRPRLALWAYTRLYHLHSDIKRCSNIVQLSERALLWPLTFHTLRIHSGSSYKIFTDKQY